MPNWKFYLGRKRITLEEFCSLAEIKSHEELIEVLRQAGVDSPTIEESNHLFVKPEPVKEQVVDQPVIHQPKFEQIKKPTKVKQNVK